MRHLLKNNAQASIETLFAMLMMVMLVFAMLKVASWAGREMAQVQIDHDTSLKGGSLTFNDLSQSPLAYVDPGAWHRPEKIGAVTPPDF